MAMREVAGWTLIVMLWNRLNPVLYPSYKPPLFHVLSTRLLNLCLKMRLRLDIEIFGLKY